MVGWCRGVVYLMSPGRPTDIGLSWTRPAIPVEVKVEGEWFYFFCFFTFIPVPLSSLSLSFISSTISSISFLPFSGRRHKMTHKDWRSLNPNTINFNANGVYPDQMPHSTLFACVLLMPRHKYTLRNFECLSISQHFHHSYLLHNLILFEIFSRNFT